MSEKIYDNGVFVRFSPELLEAVELLAADKMVSRQDIIREAVSIYTQNYNIIRRMYAASVPATYPAAEAG